MDELPKILIVDDEKDNLEALRRLLRKNYQVYCAESAENALEDLKKSELSTLSVVISDQRMPGMQGSEFLEQVTQINPLATRILLTGFSDLEAVVLAVNRGQIWRYIAKPWEPDDFLMTVAQASERSQMARGLRDSRLELERAVNELRAKDWARERLLLLLLHEFKTAPQILEGVKALSAGSPDQKTQIQFIERLESRFLALSNEISLFLDEERKVSLIPKVPEDLANLAQEFARLHKIPFQKPTFSKNHPIALTHKESLSAALEQLLAMLKNNSASLPVAMSFDWDESFKTDAYLILSINASKEASLPLPTGLAKSQSEAKLAWPLLLEPFVGSTPLEHHHSGLRTDSAKVIRQLSGLGAKVAFHIDSKTKHIELLVSFKILSLNTP